MDYGQEVGVIRFHYMKHNEILDIKVVYRCQIKHRSLTTKTHAVMAVKVIGQAYNLVRVKPSASSNIKS